MDKIKVSDYEAVLATVEKYTEGCKVGKSEVMKSAFTVNALMYGYLNGEYVTLAKTVKIISSHWINYCDMLTSITYEGSLADWAEVTKRSNWDGNAGQMPGNMHKVICLDGYMQYDTETGEWNEVKG